MGSSHPRLTYEDYVQLPDDGRLHHLIGGELYAPPTPNTRHQEVVGNVLVVLGNHLKAYGGGEVFPPRTEVKLSRTDVVQPDLVFVSDANAHRITELNIQGPPTIIVEVLSDAALDMRTKRGLYGRFGVPEYWIVDPDLDRVEVYRHGERGYGKPEILEPGDTLTTALLPRLEIDVTDLFRRR
jgi:Uma2 family endonuclease